MNAKINSAKACSFPVIPGGIAAQIPAFWLYGEADSETVPRFVHAERINVRAPVHDWRIGVHRHPDLAQTLLLLKGGADAIIDDARHRLVPPVLVWLPADIPHGYEFDAGSDGYVITIAQDFLTAILSSETCAELGGVSERLFCHELQPGEETGSDPLAAFEGIERALALGGRGVRTIVEAHLKLLLVHLARSAAIHAMANNAHGRQTALFRRFRQLLENNFRAHLSISEYANRLGLTEDRLHAICQRAAGMPPSEIVHRRLVLEAKRHLLYTTMTVKEIAYDLGFNDPAYFSRFFAKRAGMAPSAYRIAEA